MLGYILSFRITRSNIMQAEADLNIEYFVLLEKPQKVVPELTAGAASIPVPAADPFPAKFSPPIFHS